jgi:hypothetical protein
VRCCRLTLEHMAADHRGGRHVGVDRRAALAGVINRRCICRQGMPPVAFSSPRRSMIRGVQGNPIVRRDPNQQRVMIRCSVTGRAVPTGLTADPATWDARAIGLNRVACTDCKQFHAWSKNDASLEPQRPPGIAGPILTGTRAS